MSRLQDNRTAKRKIGDLGENLACGVLEKHGYKLVEKNYLRKWGEVDIIAWKGSVLHFIEVKSVSYETIEVRPLHGSQETLSGSGPGNFRPEDNMHPWKLKRLGRTIQTYLLHKKQDCDWQLDLVTVRMDMNKRRARVELIENIVVS